MTDDLIVKYGQLYRDFFLWNDDTYVPFPDFILKAIDSKRIYFDSVMRRLYFTDQQGRQELVRKGDFLVETFSGEILHVSESQFSNSGNYVAGNQTAKSDSGKLKLSLVPRQIIWDIAEVREYGNKKYGDPDNWRTVEPERYRDAAFRHFLAYLDDPYGVDEESGLKHLKHLACNIAFLCEMEGG